MKDGCSAFAEGDGLGGDDVHQGPPWLPGKTAELSFFARSSSLVRMMPRGGAEVLWVVEVSDVGVRHRVRVVAGGDQAGIVGHVDHEVGAHLVGDGAEAGEVDLARVGGGAGDDELRLRLQRALAHGVHVDQLVLLADLVAHDVEPLAGHGDGRAVGEVAAMGEVHAHDPVAGLEQRGNTAWLACAPECGWTLAKPAPKSCFTRSMARVSTSSTNSQPP